MFKAVIPARFGASRLPGKPLLDIAGKPMVVRVAEQAAQSKANEVIVATDHIEIIKACENHNIEAILTNPNWPTGTDRISEVVQIKSWPQDTIVVNIQGDEPLIDPALINQLAIELTNSSNAIATCAHPINNWDDFHNPNVVKVVTNHNGQALYFSRAPIPFPRDHANSNSNHKISLGLRHIGLYAYRCKFLQAYPKLAVQAAEEAEKLEQLRALAYGYNIGVLTVQAAPHPGVDTQTDLERIRKHFI